MKEIRVYTWLFVTNNAMHFVPLSKSLSYISHKAKKLQKNAYYNNPENVDKVWHALAQHIKASTTMKTKSCIQQQKTLSYNTRLCKLRRFHWKGYLKISVTHIRHGRLQNSPSSEHIKRLSTSYEPQALHSNNRDGCVGLR